MKVLIAIMSCQAMRDRANACRSTWVKDIPSSVDYKFFFGGSGEPKDDEVYLDAPDDYKGFPLKMQVMRRWAYERGYEWVFKCDDDTYVRPERLLACDALPTSDYVGRLRGPSGHFPAPYCSGFAYWLSRKAIASILGAEWNGDTAEDRWTANELLKCGIRPKHDTRFAVVWSKRSAINARNAPRVGNDIIAACEYPPAMMKTIDMNFKAGLKSDPDTSRFLIRSGPLNRVSVMVKTFCRDGYLHACLDGLARQLSDAKVIVVDDGYEESRKITRYAELRAGGHSCAWLPFDSGFGAKANEAIRYLDTDYVLIGSDDFDFSNPIAREGVLKMVKVLDNVSSVGVVSGRVDGRPYESCFEYIGDVVHEKIRYHASGEAEGVKYHLCDLTVNYSLIRREVFDKVSWDEDVKIGGGEHGAFFLDVKKAGWSIAIVPDAVIYQFKPNFQWQTKDYPMFRARARVGGLPCVKRRGFSKWVCQDGRVETC